MGSEVVVLVSFKSIKNYHTSRYISLLLSKLDQLEIVNDSIVKINMSPINGILDLRRNKVF